MKKNFTAVSLIIIIIATVFFAPKKTYGAKSCAYCGQYFFLGDTNPMSECMRLKSECMKVHASMDKVDACMCSVDRSAYMENLVQIAKQRTAHMFLNMAMPFMPGIHLIDPDLRKEFFDPNTPLHRRMEISLGRSTDLIGGGLGTALGAVSAASTLNDPKASNKDKLIGLIGQVLPQFENGETINSVINLGDKALELRKK